MDKYRFLEKRLFPRFPVDIPLRCSLPGNGVAYESRTHDICARGLCLFSDQEFSVGARLDLGLKMLDDGSKIYRKGKVVWSGPVNNGKYRCGIKLEDPGLKPIPIVLRTLVAQKHY